MSGSPIWLLSTRGRPRECQDTLDACEASGMTSPGVVYVDETVDEYQDIRLPKNWTIHYEPEWRSLQGSLSWCFKTYPDATQYGWLADDVRPRSTGWDKTLEAAAGNWCLSYARDFWLSELDSTRWELEDGLNLSSGLCWGGELVRTVGWWALPGVRQAFIDVAWCAIAGKLGLCRYVHDVTVEHWNYRTGKREKDAVDDWSRGGDDYIERDIEIGSNWVGSHEYVDILDRVGLAAEVELSDRQFEHLLQFMRDSHANRHWKPGMSAAKLVQVVASFDEGAERARLTEILHPHTDEGQARVAASLPPVGARPDVPGVGADRL